MRSSASLKKFALALVLASLLAVVSAAHAQGRRPTLWLVTIGVSEYERPTIEVVKDGQKQCHDLRDATRYAAKDAQDVAGIFRAQQGKLFDRVVDKMVINAQATRRGIEEALAWLRLQPIQPEDYVVVFTAGHGGPANGGYFFLPYDTNRQMPIESSNVSGSTFIQALTGLPGTRLLILDTCGAASVVRGAEAREAGIIILASCLSEQASVENHNGQTGRLNGRLTGALVEGLTGAADFNRDGVITLSELYAYVCNRVAELGTPAAMSHGQAQTPTMDHPSHVPDNLPLAVVSTSAVGLSPVLLPPVTQPPGVVPPVTTGPSR